jgi:hypothetical protein
MTDTETTLAGEVAAAVALLRDIAQNLDGIAEEIASIRDNTESIRAHIGARDLTQANTQGANASVSAHASTPGDHGSPQNPREGVQQPRGEAFTPTPPTPTGDTVDAPQNAAREFREGDRVCIPDPGTYVDGSRGNASSHVGEIVTVGASPDPDGDLWVEGDDWAGFVSAALVEPVSEEEPEPVPVEWPTEPGLYWVRGVDAGESMKGLAFLKYEAPTRTLIFARDHSIWEDEPRDRLDEAVPLTAVPTRLIEGLSQGSRRCSLMETEESVDAILTWLDDHEDGAR